MVQHIPIELKSFDTRNEIKIGHKSHGQNAGP